MPLDDALGSLRAGFALMQPGRLNGLPRRRRLGQLTEPADGTIGSLLQDRTLAGDGGTVSRSPTPDTAGPAHGTVGGRR